MTTDVHIDMINHHPRLMHPACFISVSTSQVPVEIIIQRSKPCLTRERKPRPAFPTGTSGSSRGKANFHPMTGQRHEPRHNHDFLHVLNKRSNVPDTVTNDKLSIPRQRHSRVTSIRFLTSSTVCLACFSSCAICNSSAGNLFVHISSFFMNIIKIV